jgi:hypothetical protein
MARRLDAPHNARKLPRFEPVRVSPTKTSNAPAVFNSL